MIDWITCWIINLHSELPVAAAAFCLTGQFFIEMLQVQIAEVECFKTKTTHLLLPASEQVSER